MTLQSLTDCFLACCFFELGEGKEEINVEQIIPMILVIINYLSPAAYIKAFFSTPPGFAL